MAVGGRRCGCCRAGNGVRRLAGVAAASSRAPAACRAAPALRVPVDPRTATITPTGARVGGAGTAAHRTAAAGRSRASPAGTIAAGPGAKTKISASAIYFESESYRVDYSTGLVDYDALELQAIVFQPRLIICGGSAYSRDWDYRRLAEIAKNAHALLMCDMAHTAGLIAAKQLTSPFEYCQIVTTTTHQTLRGPRGAMIFCRKNLAKAIDRAVFPACQGGPHNHTIAGIAVALHEAASPEFSEYAKRVKENASALADALIYRGFKIASGGTDNHLMLVDLSPKGITGDVMETVCDRIGIIVNKNKLPGDKSALAERNTNRHCRNNYTRRYSGRHGHYRRLDLPSVSNAKRRRDFTST